MRHTPRPDHGHPPRFRRLRPPCLAVDLPLAPRMVALLSLGIMWLVTNVSPPTRLLAGAIVMIFFTYALVNIGMVSGIFPVVGVPLPFVSNGGTALMTLGQGGGMLMGIQRQRQRD